VSAPALPSDEIREAVAGRQWYHTIELAPGVVTPGWFDTRRVAAKVPLPASLAGRRCLDVGTFDGFWAFEMERRGADEVVAIDVIDPYQWDWPADTPEDVVAALDQRKRGGSGFHIASQALGSRVQWHERNVYDLEPAELGEFDFIYFGSLLLHLRDPVRALQHARSVCRGELLVVDAVDPLLSRLLARVPCATLDGVRRPWWWRPNVAGIVRMVEAAGFMLLRPPERLRMPPGAGQQSPPLTLAVLRGRASRRALLDARIGDPHAAVLARPV
jgi:tRNA (mo5U34)-methyltransferase